MTENTSRGRGSLAEDREHRGCSEETKAAMIEVSPIEILALKKLALINGALAQSLSDATARREQLALLRVLMDVTSRAALAKATQTAASRGEANPISNTPNNDLP